MSSSCGTNALGNSYQDVAGCCLTASVLGRAGSSKLEWGGRAAWEGEVIQFRRVEADLEKCFHFEVL